jgi:hypothetical protein
MAVKIPSFDQLIHPLPRALQELGGSGSIEEIYDKVVELEKFRDDIHTQMHDPEKAIKRRLRIGSRGAHLPKKVWTLRKLYKGHLVSKPEGQRIKKLCSPIN